MHHQRVLLHAVAALAAVATAACGDDASAPEPTDAPSLDASPVLQVGSTESDTGFGLAALADGDIVMAGITQGDLGGAAQGGRDAYITRVDDRGMVVFETHLGAEDDDSPLGVSVGPNGEIYAAGFTGSSLAGPNAGSVDAWIVRLDGDGEVLWQDQFGGDDWDRVFDVTAFDGGAYLSGYTLGDIDPVHPGPGGGDAFVARYDDSGNRDWVVQFGTHDTDWGQGSALAPDGGLYVTGYTTGDLGDPNAGGRDAFVSHLTADGDVSWTTQIGTAGEEWTQGVGVAPDGNAWLAGFTSDPETPDDPQATVGLLAEVTPDGELVSSRSHRAVDQFFEVRVTEEGLYATGSTGRGDPTVSPGPLGGNDGVLFHLPADGSDPVGTRIGSSEDDDLTGLAVLPQGAVAVSGYTAGDVGGPNAGPSDLFVAHVGRSG